MAEYIDRDELLKKQYNASRFSLPEFAEMVVDVQDIEDAPAAEVAPVRHGRWEKPTKLYPFWDWKCSECGCEEYRQADSKGQYRQMAYCPNCGAKMDEK